MKFLKRNPTRGPSERVSSPDVRGRNELVDQLLEVYLTWREACAAVATAYENWNRSSPSDKRRAFCTYTAALDREEDAAATYRRLTEVVSAAVSGPAGQALSGGSAGLTLGGSGSPKRK